MWLSWWEGGIRQQLKVITFRPELSSPIEQNSKDNAHLLMHWDFSDLKEWLVSSGIWGYLYLPSLFKTYCKTSLSNHMLPTESNLATAAAQRSGCWANEEPKLRKSYSKVVGGAQLLTGNIQVLLQHSVMEEHRPAFPSSLGSDLFKTLHALFLECIRTPLCLQALRAFVLSHS